MVAPLLIAGGIAAGAALAGGIGKALANRNKYNPERVPYGEDAFRTALRAQAMGEGPSLAQRQGELQSEEARQAAMSLAASGSAPNIGAARLASVNANAAAQAQIAQQTEMARIAEREAAQGMYSGYLGNEYSAAMNWEAAQRENAAEKAARRMQNVQSIFGGIQGAAGAFAGGIPAGGAAASSAGVTGASAGASAYNASRFAGPSTQGRLYY